MRSLLLLTRCIHISFVGSFAFNSHKHIHRPISFIELFARFFDVWWPLILAKNQSGDKAINFSSDLPSSLDSCHSAVWLRFYHFDWIALWNRSKVRYFSFLRSILSTWTYQQKKSSDVMWRRREKNPVAIEVTRKYFKPSKNSRNLTKKLRTDFQLASFYILFAWIKTASY